MAFYLAPYIGTGTRQDPFRVVGQIETPGASSIDLRPDASVQTGFALLHLPVASSDSRLIKLADAKTDIIKGGVLNAVKNRLDPAQVQARLDVIIAKLLRQPPSGKWKALTPTHLREYEIWLGGEKIYSEPVISGGSVDSFTRSDESPIASPWTKVTGSDIDLVSNAYEHTGSSTDTLYYYSGASSSADHYSQANELSSGQEYGPAIRISGGSSTFNAYVYDPYAFGTPGGLFKFVSGSFTMLNSATAPYVNGDTLYIEASGSSITLKRNGTTDPAYPKTDTSLSSGNVGLWTYNNSARIDNWAGGNIGGGSNQTQAVSGKTTAAAFGSVSIAVGGVTKPVSGKTSVATLGAVTPAPGGIGVAVAGRGTAAAFGAVGATSGGVSVAVTGLNGSRALGSLTPAPGGVTVAVAGRGSAAAFGTLTVGGGTLVAVSGRGTAAAFGSVTTAVGGVSIPVAGLNSASAFGAVYPSGGAVDPALDPSRRGYYF